MGIHAFALKLGADVRNHVGNFICMRNIFDFYRMSYSFFKIELERSEGKDVPKLRFRGNARDIFEIHLFHLLVKNRRLLHPHDFIIGNKQKVIPPIEICFEKIGKGKEQPDDKNTCGDRPSGDTFCKKKKNADHDENSCDHGLVDHRKNKKESMPKDGRDFLLIL